MEDFELMVGVYLELTTPGDLVDAEHEHPAIDYVVDGPVGQRAVTIGADVDVEALATAAAAADLPATVIVPPGTLVEDTSVDVLEADPEATFDRTSSWRDLAV
ncbi:hypothetical protein [Halomarina rubra]|uniref:Uncharacterized protein n=1 Tax=Halomarina rubra TaxID=2071873 RepID=A0ABD6AS13_9EURY|nr:hypothetical protein [Halomarina rubra]